MQPHAGTVRHGNRRPVRHAESAVFNMRRRADLLRNHTRQRHASGRASTACGGGRDMNNHRMKTRKPGLYSRHHAAARTMPNICVRSSFSNRRNTVAGSVRAESKNRGVEWLNKWSSMTSDHPSDRNSVGPHDQQATTRSITDSAAQKIGPTTNGTAAWYERVYVMLRRSVLGVVRVLVSA